MEFIGELAALATSFFFAMTALIFTMTGRMVGSQVTNCIRLAFALLYLIVLNFILFREPLPFSAEPSRWLWLSLSGVIGLALGDAFLFQSLVSVGPRLGSLLLSLAPIFGAHDRLGLLWRNPYLPGRSPASSWRWQGLPGWSWRTKNRRTLRMDIPGAA